MKTKRPFPFPTLPSSWGLLVLSLIFVPLIVGACGGSEEAVEDAVVAEVGEEADTGYDATEILARLTDKTVYQDPQQIADLVADFNALMGSRDFHTAKRQVKDLSVDFRNRPMRASMAAAVMDLWNAKPPAEMTAADLEQAWEIRRIAKKTDEELAQERALQFEDRQARQSQVDARREIEEQNREEAKVDKVAVWMESYSAATVEGRSALERVQGALTDPSRKGDLGAACKALFQATQTMDGRVFQAPAVGIAQPLGKAWERYRKASRSCIKGEMAYLTTQLREGDAAMNEVSKILEGYGKSF